MSELYGVPKRKELINWKRFRVGLPCRWPYARFFYVQYRRAMKKWAKKFWWEEDHRMVWGDNWKDRIPKDGSDLVFRPPGDTIQ
jgi:hypothetical protein